MIAPGMFSTFELSYYNNATGKRDIQALPVKCSNVTRKCKWKGTVGTLEAHVATCKFTLIPCPKGCTQRKLMRKHLDKHLEQDCPNRDHTCTQCGEKGTYTHMMSLHGDTCEKKMVPCPNADCTKTIQRRNAKRHIDNCAYTEIPCKYQKIGCDVTTVRKDMPSHEEDDLQFHLDMALDKVIDLEEEIQNINSSKSLKSITSKFKLAQYQDKMFHNKAFISPAFYSSCYGYNMCVSVYANGYHAHGYVSMFAHIQKGEHDNELNWPFVGKVSIQMLNQLEDKNHYEMSMRVTKEVNLMVGGTWGFPAFIPHTLLAFDAVKNTQYLKDDTLYFKVSVDIPDNKPWLE